MTVVGTANGDARGIDHRGVLRFAGLPFAAPPTGSRRFRPPEPPDSWVGVRDATSFGATSVQGQNPLDAMLGAEPEPQDEDCLFLNVFTPACDDAARPVMVWIHGGAFVMGSGSAPVYDGSALASRGDVVVVTINYRLGTLGFLELGEVDADYAGSGNCGLLDQVAALEWVRDNIAAFGGDPETVTIFGESAGAMSVATLVCSPRADGLFRRAIAQSGAVHNISPTKQAAEVTRRFMDDLAISSIGELVDCPTDRMVEVQSRFVIDTFADADALVADGQAHLTLPFQPVRDGSVVPLDPLAALADGAARGVDLLIGTNRDEWSLFAFMDPDEVDEAKLVSRLSAMVGDGERAASVYREALAGADPKAVSGAAVTDLVFRQPAIRLAEKHAPSTAGTFMYLFTWATPSMGGILGSCHAIDVPFVFGSVDAPGLAMLLGDDPPSSLVDAMQQSWLAFARTGDPSNDVVGSWPAYEFDRRATMRFDSDTLVVDDPEASRRELWTTAL